MSVDVASKREFQEAEPSRQRLTVVEALPEIGIWYLESSTGSRYFADSRTSLNGIELSANLVLGALVNGEGYALSVFPLDRL